MTLRLLKQRAQELSAQLEVQPAEIIGDKRKTETWRARVTALEELVAEQERQNQLTPREIARLAVENRARNYMNVEMPDPVLHKQSLGTRIREYLIKNINNNGEPIIVATERNFLERALPKIHQVAEAMLREPTIRVFRLGLLFNVGMYQYTDEDQQIESKSFVVKYHRVNNSGEILPAIEHMYADFLEKLESYIEGGSDWVFSHFDNIQIHISKENPLVGRSYEKLPAWIELKHAIINPKNNSGKVNDNKCFKWAVLIALTADIFSDHQDRLTKFLKPENAQYLNMLKFDGLSEGDENVRIEEIEKFEKLNNIAVHVLTCNEVQNEDHETIKEVTPLRRSKLPFEPVPDGQQPPKVITLFYYKKHYSWVKDVSRLLSAGRSEHDHASHYCMNCLLGYQSEKSLTEHQGLCLLNGVSKVSLPTKDPFTYYGKSFSEYLAKMRYPFTVFGDTESVLIEEETQDDQSGQTRKTSHHVICGYSLFVVSAYPEYQNDFKPILFRGEDAKERFTKAIIWLTNKIYYEYLSIDKPMIMSPEDEQVLEHATHCHICEKPLEEFTDIFTDRFFKPYSVRDHDHYNGKFRGPAHAHCNTRFTAKKTKVPVFFHNLKGYDAHHIITELAKYETKIDVIANSSEKYMTFGTPRIRFLDSLQFFAPGSSLALCEIYL